MMFKRSNETGVALTEFSITIPLLFLIVNSFIDFSLYFYQYAAVSYALSETARAVAVGMPEAPQTEQLSPFPNIRPELRRAAEARFFFLERLATYGLYSDLNSLTLFRICPAHDQNCLINNAGRGEDFIHISVEQRVPFFFSNFHLRISNRMMVRNEPFV